MKRIGNLFDKITDIENIRLAHKKASKGKQKYTDVKMVNKDVDHFCFKIKTMLDEETFENSKYKVINKKCGKKMREIYKLPYYPDRIIHHSIMQILEPMWESLFINDTYSCIKKRGIHKGVKRLKEKLRNKEETKYCLKFDIEKFYPSIDNKIMKDKIRKKIKDKKLLRLLDKIIDSSKGLPIGNYLSQYLGNLYLSYFDQYCKNDLKIKHYFRYCDDIVILSNNKEELWLWFNKINEYLINNLKLKIKDNYQIFPVEKRGIDFLGYVFYHEKTLLRKSIKMNLIKTINKKNNLEKRLASYNGWLKHCNSYNLRKKYNLLYLYIDNK